jgi:hypothetical protein
MIDDFIKRMQENQNALKAANLVNKAAVFDALTAAMITRLEVEFDGEGDSGGLTGTTAYNGDAVVGIPPASVKLILVEYYGTETTEGEKALTDAIEILCFDYIGEAGHSGWENNDGAYGTFRFDVANRRIELEFNARFTDVSTSTHEF